MGIDIYAHWAGQTDDEKAAQVTGFSIVHGHVGYLREAYHGGPYATRVLVPEAFDDGESEDGVPIPAAMLRQRLSDTLKAVATRSERVYHETLAEDSPVLQAYRDFVALCERKEQETGQPVKIYASY